MNNQWIVSTIIKQIKEITELAVLKTSCKRKGVGCQLIRLEKDAIIFQDSIFNGPSGEDFECSNEVGNCGCMHSEPKAIMQSLKKYKSDLKWIMLCSYSPCTNCANIIINSGIVEGVVYDILTLHDKRGEQFLRRVMPVFSLFELHNEEVDDTISRWKISNTRSK
jgi:deoxycytidylate deaminase